MEFERLIRFMTRDGRTVYGNLDKALNSREILGREVRVVNGSLEEGFSTTEEMAIVDKLLSPLPTSSIPLVLCAGLNYNLHVKETNSALPSKPVIFMTPATRVSGPLDEIEAHDEAQPMLDYEGELTLVFGKDAKNVSEDEAIDYLLGYTVGNDVSARNMVGMEVTFNQMGHSKSYDTFGPIGPCITSPKVLNDPHNVDLMTKVNGEIRQQTSTGDMIWQIPKLVSWVSQNRTIKKGTCLMTGTPSGVGWATHSFLKDGDVVEVSISGIGSISNKIVFI